VQPCTFELPLLASFEAAQSGTELHTTLQLLVYKLAWQFAAQLVLAPLALVHCTLPEEPRRLLQQLVQAALLLHRSLVPVAAERTLERQSLVQLPLSTLTLLLLQVLHMLAGVLRTARTAGLQAPSMTLLPVQVLKHK
jgi:hypothetical protein